MKNNEINAACIMIEEFMLKGGSEIYVQRYYEDWCSLMPVVERIERMGYDVLITKKTCTISNTKINRVTPYHRSITSLHSKTDAVFISIVEFIQWFNRIKK